MSSAIATGSRIQRQVSCFQEITQLMLPWPETEGILRTVFATMATALPTSTAVLIAETEGQPRTQLWCSPAVTAEWAQAAIAHAKDLYAFLVDSDQVHRRALQDEEPCTWRTLPSTTKAVPTRDGYVFLPLVVGGIFGALQLVGALQVQAAVRIDLIDLAFIAAVTNLMALAIYRQQAWSGARKGVARVFH